MVLFGGNLELEDIKRAVQKQLGDDAAVSSMQTPFVIAPIDRNDFQKLGDPIFLQLLACFGVNVNVPGQVYPRVDSTVQPKHFENTVKLMKEAMTQLFGDNMDGEVTLDMVEEEKTDMEEVAEAEAPEEEEDEE